MEDKAKDNKFSMNVNVRRVEEKDDLFEFTITTPTLRSQFRLPRTLMNELRILIERVLTEK